MRSWKLASAVLVSISLAVPPVPAVPPAARKVQEPRPASIDAMKKLDRWIGDWSGKGWTISREGRRIEFDLSEKVQSKVGADALQGRDQTYVLPPMSVRVLSLVPADVIEPGAPGVAALS